MILPVYSVSKNGFLLLASTKSRLLEEDHNFQHLPSYLFYPGGEKIYCLGDCHPWCCPYSVLKRVTHYMLCIFHQERSECTLFQIFWKTERAEEGIRVCTFSKNMWLFIIVASQRSILHIVKI